MVAGIGVVELIVILVALGGAVPSFGVPLPPDATLQGAAPQECLLYMAASGTGEPDAKSGNQMEQLLAESEVREFVGEIRRLIDEGLKRLPSEGEPQATLSRTMPTIVQTLLSQPVMLYVSQVDLPPQPPGGKAALVVNAGNGKAAFVAALHELERLYLNEAPPGMKVEASESDGAQLRRLPTPPEVPPLVWGVQGSYVFLAVGEGEGADLAKRLAAKGAAPAWLADVHAKAAVPPAGTIYLNVAATLKTVDPLIDTLGRMPVDVRRVMSSLGLQHLRYAAVVSGFNDVETVSKLIVAHDGEADGVIKFLQAPPLTTADLKRIPQTVDMAAVNRLDLQNVFDEVLEVVKRVDAQAHEQAVAVLGFAEDQVGFRLRDDLCAGLGDKWTIYNSPNDGGMLLTGLCASVAVRDRHKVEQVIENIRLRGETIASQQGVKFEIRSTAVGERKISYLQFLKDPVPVAPAWCLTDDELVIAIMPQMVRAHLSRPADAPTLADSKELADRLATGDVTGISFSNPKLGFDVLYSYVNFGAAMGASALEKETGIRADLAKFPSYAVISRHLRPSVGIVRSTKDAWIAEGYGSGPAIGPTSIAGVGMAAALILPAIQNARESARQAASMNTLRQLSLAAINYSFRYGKPLPRAICDADGKPLLSWRVSILPDIDQQDLYEQFHLDEPWDSDHNRTLIPLMPSLYLHPSTSMTREEGLTVYQIPVGKGTLYDGVDSPTQAAFDAVSQSASAMFVEAHPIDAVTWTKPDDLTIDPSGPLDSLYRLSGMFVQMVMADGSVQKYASPADDETIIRRLLPRSSR